MCRLIVATLRVQRRRSGELARLDQISGEQAFLSFPEPRRGSALTAEGDVLGVGWGGGPGALLNGSTAAGNPRHTPAAAPAEKELGNLLSSSSCMNALV